MMETKLKTTQQLIAAVKGVSNSGDMQVVADLIREQPGNMAAEVQDALLEKLSEFTARSENARQNVINMLQLHGVEYPLSDWITPRNYALRFGIKNAETVINWINRGVIEEENVKVIPELDLRLVRAIEYQPRSYVRAVVKN